MLGLKRVAVTGGISCGKSLVCQILQKLGACTVSADELAHRYLSSQSILGQQVIALLGTDIVEQGEIKRSLVAKKVFNDPEKLATLESLLHPAVKTGIEEEYQKALASTQIPLFVAEIPLLFETGAEKNFDTVIAVVADPTLCCERFQAATGQNAQDYEKRMRRQDSAKSKAARADYLITNNGSIEQLEKAVKSIYDQLTHSSKTPST